MFRRLLLVVVFLASAGAARGDEPDSNCATPSSTFELIQRGIFDRRGCNMSYCHGADRQAGLDLRPDASYANLVGGTGDYTLVEPGRPEDSLLWLVLAKKTLQLTSVQVPEMPKDGLPLSADELEGIRLWILAGAPESGVVAGVAEVIDLCPQPATADDNIADLPTCQRNDPSLLLPNLVPDPPADIRVFARNGKRRVVFTTRVGNTGDGPLIIQARTLPAGPGHTVDAMQVILRKDGSKCTHRAGIMRFQDGGNRWQYGNFADFELRRDDPTNGPVVAWAGKPAYCLVDSDVIRGWKNRQYQYELHCTDPIGRMGISVGYKDTYSRVHPAQWIDLDTDPSVPIERGTYYLMNIADPNNHLWEKDDKRDDNLSYTTLRLGLADPDPPESLPPAAPTVRPTATQPPPSYRAAPPTPTHTLQQHMPTPTRTLRQRTPRPTRTPRSPRLPLRPDTLTPGVARPRHPVRPAQPSRPARPQHPSVRLAPPAN